MKSFERCQRVWAEKVSAEGLEPLLRDRLSVYLKDPTEEGVGSAFELLVSFDFTGLCVVLELHSSREDSAPEGCKHRPEDHPMSPPLPG